MAWRLVKHRGSPYLCRCLQFRYFQLCFKFAVCCFYLFMLWGPPSLLSNT